MAATINEIIEDLKRKEKFGRIVRFTYRDDLPADNLLAEIEAVGRYRDPRFVIDDDNRFAYTNLAKWLVGDPTMECLHPDCKGVVIRGDLNKGIYLAGGTGTGKTWAMDIISHLALANGMKIRVFGRDEAFHIVPTKASTAVEKFTLNEDPLTQRVLCFNDLGTEPREGVYMGNRLEVMRDYIEDRADSPWLMTCFTSNYPMTHEFIAERYGERAVSRLRQMCNYLEMRGKDRRRV